MASGEGFDVAVVGAGVVGLATALLLAEAGRRVVVVTAEPVGGGTSGRSAGIVSGLHGTAYSRFARETAAKNAAAYRAMNDDGFALLEGWIERFGVASRRRDALLVALDERSAARVDDEHLAARRAGLPVVKEQRPDLPFPTLGALRLRDQLVVDPRALLAALAAAAIERGVVLAERERVTGVHVGPRGPVRVVTDAAEWIADDVVLATGTPILDRGLYLAKTGPVRQVVLGGAADPALPVLTTLAPHGSTTLAVGDDGRAVAFGGAHPTGSIASEVHRAASVQRGLERLGVGFRATSTWSAQDYRPYNPIAFVGVLPRSFGRVRFATGFDGWGLTNGAGAAIRLAAQLGVGPRPAWATTIGRRATRPPSVALGVGSDARAAARGLSSLLALQPGDVAALADGAGVVHRTGDGVVATSRVDGVLQRVAGTCPRLGGALTWNDLELSWDCPVCGARWSADGAVLEGGARDPLRAFPVDGV